MHGVSCWTKKWFDTDFDVFYQGFEGEIFNLRIYINCDDAGKNKAIENLCKKDGLGILLEYTAPIPQNTSNRMIAF